MDGSIVKEDIITVNGSNEVVKPAENRDTELLQQILEENKKRSFYARVTAIASTAVLAVVIICLLIVLPDVNALIKNADSTLTSAQEALLEAENAAVGLSAMSENIVTTSEELNTFISQNSSSVTEAVEKMAGIDYEGLNKAIQDLQDAVEPFAKFVNRFK